jgi:methyl-accepting chemotaxis protein
MSETDRQAAENARILERAIAAMERMQSAAGEIDQIVGFIDGLAFQTNMLALNASIEAGRAGEAGKGFDVVANAVRALAERRPEAARNIKVLTDRSSDEVRAGAQLVLNSGDAMKAIITKVSDGSVLVGEIAASADDQTAGIVQVREAIASIDEMTQKNAAMGEQCNAAARLLRAEADRLQALVNRFDAVVAA